jgi:hypothetical protein
MHFSCSAKSYKARTTMFYMCSLGYGSITNPQKIDEASYIHYELKEEVFTKVMEGPGGYFLEPD